VIPGDLCPYECDGAKFFCGDWENVYVSSAGRILAKYIPVNIFFSLKNSLSCISKQRAAEA
jgi:hypothetical protein